MVAQLLLEAANLMFIGMVAVFAFLLLLVFIVQLISAFMLRYFPVKRLDPFVGLQVGFSAIQTNERSERIYNSAFAVKSGLNYHVYKFFYFFLECQYIHQSDPWHARPLDQFMGTGGLGFQLPCKNYSQTPPPADILRN